MTDKLISFETAKLVDKKNIVLNALYKYHILTCALLCESDIQIDDIQKDKIIDAPSQSLLQRWLRETHNIHILIFEDFYELGINYLWQVLIYDPLDRCDDLSWCSHKSSGLYGDNGEYKTYEEALEEGLKKGLTFI